MKINEIIKNPFVIAGSVGLLVFFYMKTQEKKKVIKIKEQPKDNKKLEQSVTKEKSNSQYDTLPKDFLKDVAKMDKEDIKHTINLNLGLAKRKNLSKIEKERLNLMLQYLKEKYAND
jgi:hypothetical protein